MKKVRFLALTTAVLLLLTIPCGLAYAFHCDSEDPTFVSDDSSVFGQTFIGSWQAGDDGYTFVSDDPDAPTAVCEKVEIQGGVFYYDAATGTYYNDQGQNVTNTVYSGKSTVMIPSAEGPILLELTGSVAFYGGKCFLGYKGADGKEYFFSPEDLMSEMGRIDFLIFIGDTGAKPQKEIMD